MSMKTSYFIHVREKKPIALIHVREKKPIALIHGGEKNHVTHPWAGKGYCHGRDDQKAVTEVEQRYCLQAMGSGGEVEQTR